MTTEADADEAFVRYKSRYVLSWALANARSLHKRPCATAMGTPLSGRTALIVGAAATLEDNGHLIAELQAQGAVVIGVNSSDPVLRHLGVTPDAIVVRESIDMSADVQASKAPLVCLDLCAHPAAWAAAGERAAWFVPGYPHTAPIHQLDRVMPLYGGSSALTSAVALCLAPAYMGGWGASRIVLVGVTLAFVPGPDGTYRSYHSASPRGDNVSRVVDGWIHTEGNEQDDERCKRTGQKPPAKKLPAEWVTAWDNSGKLPTISTMRDQKAWLEIEAERHGSRVELLNATEGGAAIVGWRNVTLDDVSLPRRVSQAFAAEYEALYGEPAGYTAPEPVRFPATYAVSRSQNESLLDTLRQEADQQRKAAEELLRPTGPRLSELARLRKLHLGAPVAEALAAHRVIDAPQGDPLGALHHVYTALRDAAIEAGEILGG